MKLSEAIRLGAMMKPQWFEKLHDGDGSCALGAAADAIGFVVGELFSVTGKDSIHAFFKHFPEMEDKRNCPVCGLNIRYSAIAHLNDFHRWTRERIADFVETLESDTLPDLPTPELAVEVEG